MMSRWVLRYWAVLAVGVILVVIMGLAEFGRFTLVPLAVPGATPAPVVTETAAPLLSASPLPEPRPVGIAFSQASWLVHLIVAIVIVIGLAGLVAAIVLLVVSLLRIRLARPHRPAPTAELPYDPEVQRADLLAAVDAGIAELDDDDIDPRAAVIACWVRLERVAAGAGIAERPDRTSSDLVAELLANQRVSADTLASFAELYRTARYSRHTIEAAMRDDARAALRRLRNDIALDARATA
jgi:hypothetical protein